MAWVAAAAGSRAEAQFTYQRPQTNAMGSPVVSPYVNMARGGNAAVNYYGLVRPQLDTTRSLQQLQQQVLVNQTPGGQVEQNNATSMTGHAVQFFNYGNYFPMMTGGTRPGTSALGGAATTYQRPGKR
jgi:hypothetical protein